MNALPLQHLRIIDHTIAWAGPQGTLLLADMGAEVIKIEAAKRPDVMRGGGAAMGLTPYFWEKGPWFLQINRNKKSLILDLNNAAGKELYFRLVKTSDAVIDNFTPRVMHNLGIGYEELKKVKPDIIVVHLPGYGSTGPYKDAPAYGDCINAFSGLDNITGYPDKPNMRPGIAYGDPTSGFAAAFGLLAAINYRNFSGQGQEIDVSHFEATSKSMDGLVDYAMNREIQRARGNKDPLMAPQGCYPCRGVDCWITITIAGDREWQIFGKITGNMNWTQDPRFKDLPGRHRHHEELDHLIAAWTLTQDRYEATELLQQAGIAAGPVLEAAALMNDPHLKERAFYEQSSHPYTGHKLLPGILFKLSKTPGQYRWPAPLFGEHNDHILKTIPGMSETEISELAKNGVIADVPNYV